MQKPTADMNTLLELTIKFQIGYIEEPEIAVLGERLDDSWLTAYWCEEVGRNALCGAYNENGSPCTKRVSHWMPLPDKPIKNKK